MKLSLTLFVVVQSYLPIVVEQQRCNYFDAVVVHAIPIFFYYNLLVPSLLDRYEVVEPLVELPSTLGLVI